eukprot:GHVT01101729.1.p1 GENE.GHVT01101729.1~~GHVT01101729.1.p1  ORF type:complete len:220 (-),score=31.21 GHVT01101729.1:313-972(-)
MRRMHDLQDTIETLEGGKDDTAAKALIKIIGENLPSVSTGGGRGIARLPRVIAWLHHYLELDPMAFIQSSSQRRLLTSSYRLVDSNDFPQYGTFNHRVEYAANGERLWCCDHFPDVKLSQPELPCTAQPTHVTTRHSSSVGDAKHWGGDWTLYAATAVIGAAALLFLKKVFWGTGAKKNANSARNTYLRGQSGNRAHVVPRDAKTNSLDPTFAQYRKNK